MRKKRLGKNPIFRLLSIGKQYMAWLCLTFVVLLAGIVLTILSSWYLGKLSESAILMDFDKFVEAVVPMLIVFMLQIPISFVSTYAANRFAEYTMLNLRNKITRHIQSLPLTYIERNQSGDILSRLNSDTSVVQGFLQDALLQLLVQPLTFFACAAFLFYLSFELSMVSFTAIPIFMAITLLISKPLEKHSKEVLEAVAQVTGVAQSAISGMPEAKSFRLEPILGEKFDKAVSNSVRKGLRMSKVSAFITPINNMMQFVPYMLVSAYGGFLVISERLSFGELIMFINLTNAVVGPLHILPQVIGSYRLAKSAGARLFELSDEAVEITGIDYAPVEAEADAIEFKDVCFAYDGKEMLLTNFNMRVSKGETVALVGSSGCGKSTLVKLMAGFYKPQKGDVKIFGVSVSNWDIEKLREKIAVVSQDVFLFPCSIFENIAYGKRDASREEVYDAARIAGIHDFIESLPEGYDTHIGERGFRLSGGQRQRISIARAILKNSPILLLDEATSALDVESENSVLKNLDEFMKDRTTITIAHRFSTIKSVLNIFVMEKGTVISSGKHENLLETSDTYRRLYLKQINLTEESEIVSAC